MTPEDIKQLKVAELKEELSKRGLSTSGLKKDLVSRLIKASRDENKTNKDISVDGEDRDQKIEKEDVESTVEEHDKNAKRHSGALDDRAQESNSINKKDEFPTEIRQQESDESLEAEHVSIESPGDSPTDMLASSDREHPGAGKEKPATTADTISSSSGSVNVAFEEARDEISPQDSIDQQPERVEEDQTSLADELIGSSAFNEKENLHLESTASQPLIKNERNPLATIYESTSVLGTDHQFIYERCLSISRLLPPFDIPDLEALLEEFGVVEDFYLNFAKSQAFVRYASEEMAKAALTQLKNQRWPRSFGELLFVTSIPLEEVLATIETESKIIGPSAHKGFARRPKRMFDEVESDSATASPNNIKRHQKKEPEDSESSGFDDIFDDIEDEDTIFDPSLLDGCSSDMEENASENTTATAALSNTKTRAIPLSSITKLSDLKLKEEKENTTNTKAYLPGMPLDPHDELRVNTGAYDLFKELSVEWPCMSFDFLFSHVNKPNISFSFVAGSQADTPSRNRLYCIKSSGLVMKTRSTEPVFLSDDENDEYSDDEDELLGESHLSLSLVSVPHQGCVNRVRVSKAPGISPFIASWSDTGKVFVWDSEEIMANIDNPANSVKNLFIGDESKKRHRSSHTKILPLAEISEHGSIEGFSLAWSDKGTPGRLLTGDCGGRILLTQLIENRMSILTRFNVPSVSVEDLLWSPVESEVFASCDTSGTIRIWDTRQNSAPVALIKASNTDVNVMSWNPISTFLLASGADSGEWAIWDLRKVASQSKPVIAFDWHKAPISSIEWHPAESSVITVSGSDDQLTIWDLALEQDESPEKLDAGIPPQLLFIHQGQNDMKEAHWVSSPSQAASPLNSVLVSTAASGFHIFKPFNI